MLIGKSGCGVYKKSLYYLLNFSINLNCSKIKSLFKRRQTMGCFCFLTLFLSFHFFFFFLIYREKCYMVPWGGRATFIFIFLIFLAVLGLCCCAARGLSLVAVSRAYSSLWCTGFSLWWLLLLQSTGSRPVASVVVAHGLISCGLRALEHRLSSCGAWA